MVAMVCHGLQSCLESQLVESRIHGPRLPSSKPKSLTPPPQLIDLAFKSCYTKSHCEGDNHKTTDTAHSNPISIPSSSSNNESGGWSFIQALSNVSKEPLEKETPPYVHPQVKLSSVRMSPESLELCTENLGNETGTDILESGIDLLSSLDCGGGNLRAREQWKSRQLFGANNKTKPQNFPPPLTTIRGSESLRVRPHREGGRLVIEATKAPSSASCLRAERSHGRLRLSLLENPSSSFNPGEDENEGFEGEFESEMNGQRQDVDEEEAEEEEEDEEEQEEEEEEEAEEEAEAEAEVEVVENGDGERDAYGVRMEKYEIERGSRRNRGSSCKEEGDHENNELLINGGISLGGKFVAKALICIPICLNF